MTDLIGADVALAFNSVNERKTWSARHYATNGAELVHFTGGRANLVTLVLDCQTKRFRVRFNKVHAAWGDYVSAIAKALYVTLTTLKAAGLPFEAPPSHEGIEIIVTQSEDGVYARWPGQTLSSPAAAIMPEIRTPETVAEVKGALDAAG